MCRQPRQADLAGAAPLLVGEVAHLQPAGQPDEAQHTHVHLPQAEGQADRGPHCLSQGRGPECPQGDTTC